MEIEKIVEKFAIMSNLSQEEALEYILIIKESMDQINNIIKKNINILDINNIKRLNSVTAALSYYKYILYRNSNDCMESLTAGDFKIKSADKKETVKIAFNIWQDEKNSVSDLLEDKNFLFKRADNINE